MIYVLKESQMNGTVTMSTKVYGVEADTFADAMAVVEGKLKERVPNAEVALSADALSYRIDSTLPIIGSMGREPLVMLA